MRQTLLRIRLDDWFTLAPLDGITAIGVGWIALVVVPLFVWWLARHWGEIVGGGNDALLTALIGGAVCLAMTTAPLWAPLSFDGGPAAIDGAESQPAAIGAKEDERPRLPPFVPVYGYGFMLFIGFVTAAWWAGRRSRAVGLSTDVVLDSCMWLFFGGILGARLFYLLQYHRRAFANVKGWDDALFRVVNLPDGGLVLYGGVILGSVCFVTYCRRRGLPALLIADVLMPSFFVGLGFGRLGCFLNGCCYGDTCRLPWGVHFPHGSVPHDALVGRGVIPPDALATPLLHPTQLYSALNAFLLALLFHAYFRYRPRNGSIVALALLTYPVTRFVIEYLRADETGQFNTSLTISQWVSIGLFTTGVLFQTWLVLREREPSTTNQIPV